MKHYAIGDVHGEYELLLKLVGTLPKDSKLYFVGDLIDRGPDSKKVVNFVRSGNHKCALGNHEDMMIEESKKMKKHKRYYRIGPEWAQNGGISTLMSYGIVEETDDGFRHTEDLDCIDRFIEDAEWMRTLPLAITAGVKHNGLDIVITHAAAGRYIDSVVGAEPGTKAYNDLKNHTTWNRGQRGPGIGSNFFNIFGHTPKAFSAGDNWINIDSGAVCNGGLTAFDMENGLIFRENR